MAPNSRKSVEPTPAHKSRGPLDTRLAEEAEFEAQLQRAMEESRDHGRAERQKRRLGPEGTEVGLDGGRLLKQLAFSAPGRRTSYLSSSAAAAKEVKADVLHPDAGEPIAAQSTRRTNRRQASAAAPKAEVAVQLGYAPGSDQDIEARARDGSQNSALVRCLLILI